MFLAVSELQLCNLDFDLKIAPGQFNFLDETLRQESDLAIEGIASLRESTQEILVQGFLVVQISFPCDRCLERVRQRVEREFSLAYLPEALGPVEDDREIGEAETDVGFYSGGGIELDDLIRELVLLELPMRRVCEPECAVAPAQRLGVNLATDDAPRPDSRWDALSSFRRKDAGQDDDSPA